MNTALQQAQEQRLQDAWRNPTGWRYWSSVNNSIVGVWYIATSFVFFLFAGVLALIMRTQLALPDNDLVSALTYDQLFTLHGSVMMFLFGVPIFEAISILLLPQLLGARDLPFPRLSAFGFWCFLIGGVFVCGSIFFGAAPSGGWFMYPPLTTAWSEGLGPDIWLLGLSFIEVASIAAAVELIVGVLKTRPPGMRINLMPLYAWYVLVVAVMILFAFPPLIAGDLLFELERAFDWPFFDAARGGDPLLWQHLFWIFGHPEVYIIFLPSVALIAMIVPTFARRPIVGYGWIVLAAIGVGFLSFGLWVHHMYTTGMPNVSLGFFSAASEAVAIPTGIQIFCFLATLWAGRRVRSVPMLWAAGALAIFVLGGLTGVMVALAPFDFQAHDTYFVVAHLHYVLVGGVVFPVVAGLYYFFPVATGKLLSPKLGKLAFWLMFTGFNVGFLPMHLTGLVGMPRRVFTYPAGMGFDTLNLVSTLGAYVLAAGVAVLVLDVLRPKKAAAPRNPWSAGTLEWLPPLPTPGYSVRAVPGVHSRYPLWQQPGLVERVDAGDGYLPDAEEGLRETLITTTLDARPLQCFRVPGPSWWPLWAALFIGASFIVVTFGWYTSAAIAMALGIAAVLGWLWTGTGRIPEKPCKDVGQGVVLPLYASGPRASGWWALCITMVGDMAAFLALLFGYFYYWTIHPAFPAAAQPQPQAFWLLLGLALLLGAWLAMLLARQVNAQGHGGALHAMLGLALALAGAGCAALLRAPAGLEPTAHVYPAMVWVLVGWTVLHGAVGMLMQAWCIARRLGGFLDARHGMDLDNSTLYWHFTAVTALLAVLVLSVFPELS